MQELSRGNRLGLEARMGAKSEKGEMAAQTAPGRLLLPLRTGCDGTRGTPTVSILTSELLRIR